ncbi:MAG: hypothetical protein R3F17_04945 [Planctomycetota bacterium]
MRFRALALCFAALTALAPAASAHDGPPYPICVDEAIGSLTLSIWADPDVGEGTFYYYVEPPADGVRVQAVARFQGVVSADGSSIPGDIEVRGISQDPEARAPYQQIGTLPFEHRGDWKGAFLVERGEQVLGQIELPIKLTPRPRSPLPALVRHPLLRRSRHLAADVPGLRASCIGFPDRRRVRCPGPRCQSIWPSAHEIPVPHPPRLLVGSAFAQSAALAKPLRRSAPPIHSCARTRIGHASS